MHKRPQLFWGTSFLSICLLVAGCQSPPPYPPNEQGNLAIRNNSYSLLYQLLNQQKGVSILRFIKSENLDLKNITKKISEASKVGAEQLEEFHKRDPSIVLTDLWLPPGEVKTRAAISSTKEKELLEGKGRSFRLSLLLTQTEALSYASHLAKVISQHDSQPDRVRAMTDMSREMDDLYHEVVDLILDNGR